jgi:triphosphoribosyl-dephospho-CoA synthase
MPRLSEDDIGGLFLAACRAELAALKPGNVHVHAGGHDMEAAQFEKAAEAAAPWVAAGKLKVGTRILRAVEASFAAAGCNTNLGILLLCAPLAKAAESKLEGGLRPRLHAVLASLDGDDAASVYAAIRKANPGGLGDAPQQDVAMPPSVGILDAMTLAADRDRIARAYVDAFTDIFDFGLPALSAARAMTEDDNLAVTTLHMTYLAQFPDSHIARKHGPDVAETIRTEASSHAPLWQPVAKRNSMKELLEFDADLKRRRINPGTTADFVVATLFTASLCDALGFASASEPPCVL